MLNRETRSHVFLYLTYMLLFLRSSVYFPETALAQASQRELEKVRLRDRDLYEALNVSGSCVHSKLPTEKIHKYQTLVVPTSTGVSWPQKRNERTGSQDGERMF